MVKVGDTVKVFGHRVAKVVAVSTNTSGVVKRVKTFGDFSGWTMVKNVTVVTA